MTKVNDTQQLRFYLHRDPPLREVFTVPSSKRIYRANDIYWADGDQVRCGPHSLADRSVLFRTEQELIDAGYTCGGYQEDS